MRNLIVVCLFFTLSALPAAAHDDLVGQLHHVTELLEQQPRNAQLWLRRAELHRLNEEWDKAEGDYRRALQFDPSLEAAQLGRGLLLLESGHAFAAVAPLRQYLAKQPDDTRARGTLARALVQLGNPGEAAAQYDAALAEAPDPDLISERARALAAAGRMREALHTLDAEMIRLGPIPSLQLLAIELELQACDGDAALQRIAVAEASAPRKETWLVRRGDILRKLDREEEAREAYAEALDALNTLPPARRQTRAMRDLETRLREATAR